MKVIVVHKNKNNINIKKCTIVSYKIKIDIAAAGPVIYPSNVEFDVNLVSPS